MKFHHLMTDDVALAELGTRIGRHRVEQNQTQAQLAEEAGISKRTLERMEAGRSTQLTNLIRVLRALNLLAGLNQLVPEPLVSPLAELEKEGRQRVRASRRVSDSFETDGGWTWSDE